MNKTHHDCNDLITIFNEVFEERFNTRLVLGGNEPIYIPANVNTSYHQVIFAHGFFSSALHEIAHWCVAGEKRRKCIDYGYWYIPDGRNTQQQKAFERVEVKPQALEWVFSQACDKPFKASVDNLTGEQTDSLVFKQALLEQVRLYCLQGLPERATLFYYALCCFYRQSDKLLPQSFLLSEC